jgi:Mg-chelatase subunit ChlD
MVCNEKIDLLKQTMLYLISELTDRDRLSIVIFNTAATRVLELRRMTSEGKEAANNAIARMVAGGGTSIACGLQRAVRVLEQRRTRNPVASVMLLTDGHDSVERPSNFSSLLESARIQGSAVHTFGFGADHDSRYLASIAQGTSGTFCYIEQLHLVHGAFAGVRGCVCRCV